MASITEALRGAVSPERLAQLEAVVDKAEYDGGIETVTSGALSVSKKISLISVTGTIAYTLADGTYAGQVKQLRCTAAASTPVGTLTPAHASGFTTILFDAANEEAELVWTSAGWVIALIVGATAS